MQDHLSWVIDRPNVRISRRLKALRESKNLTQEALAARMGIPHRQIVSSMEAGERDVSGPELARAAQALGVDVSVLTDPFRLVGEGRFSFRSTGTPRDVLDRFEDEAGRWVATFRALQSRAGVPTDRIGVKLELDPHSSFEDAHRAAGQIREAWQLGDVPAEALRDAIERELGAQILYIDAPAGLSGAAVQLPGYSTILVNRNEPEGRRNFDLAHELFHLLTWDAMPPPRVEPQSIAPTKGNRVEKLAENFAGALLMPAPTVGGLWENRARDGDLPEWLNRTATSLRVTSIALKWRLVVLGMLSKARAAEIPDESLANNGGLAHDSAPLPFSRAFIGRVYHAVEDGWLSLRKACALLGMEPRAFDGLCRAYGLELSYEV